MRQGKFAQGSRRMRGRRAARAAKKIHIKVKRGKPDGVTRVRGEKRRKGEGEERREEEGEQREGEKERRVLVASLRVLFLLPCSSSALMFSLLWLSYPPFDFSCTPPGSVLCRHLDSQSCHLNNRHSEIRALCILRK